MAHKSEIGGVRLGLHNADAVREACRAIVSAVPDGIAINGTLVAPMRSAQLELVVSVNRDAVWGPMLLVGLGGIWVEILDDCVLLPLPASASRIAAALRQLRAAPLFDGARGKPAVDVDALAGIIEKIALAALDLGPDLETLEINPLAVLADGFEAMDALAIYGDCQLADR